MFTAEDGAMEIIENATDKYQKQFDEEFPLYEYTYITGNDNYDFTVDGAKQLAAFINGRIDIDKPVTVPDDYYERDY